VALNTIQHNKIHYKIAFGLVALNTIQYNVSRVVLAVGFPISILAVTAVAE